MRLRLHREHLKIKQRFVHPKFRVSGKFVKLTTGLILHIIPLCSLKLTSTVNPELHNHSIFDCPEDQTRPPLEFLFLQSDTDYDDLMTFPSIKTEIQYMRFCTRIIPGEEICGEIILTRDIFYFIPELNQSSGERGENVEASLASIVCTLRRRYTHENKAIEIFVGSRSFLFTFKNVKDREEFISFLQVKPASSHQSRNSLFMNSNNLTTMTNKWMKGDLSNFDYLMYLNTAAGTCKGNFGL